MEKNQGSIFARIYQFLAKGWWPDNANPWLIYERTFKPNFRMFITVALAKGLWHKTLANGTPLYKFLSLDVEQDKEDSTLKIYSLTILSLILIFEWVPKPIK
jgi:hypothetical protein